MKFFSEIFKNKASHDTTSAPQANIKHLLSYRVANLQGIGGRARQEDSFALVNGIDVTKIREKGLLAVVADGMGGMNNGKIASEKAVESIRSDFERFDYSENLSAQLSSCLYNASSELFSILDGDGGSTAVVCLCYGEKLYFSSIGDSFLILKRNDQAYYINRRHTVFHRECLQLIRDGIMDPRGPKHDSERNALYQFLGIDGGIDDIDCFKRPLSLISGDVILLCSDGVGGVLSEKELSLCLSGNDPAKMCESIEKSILAKGIQHQDNYTAVVIKCEY